MVIHLHLLRHTEMWLHPPAIHMAPWTQGSLNETHCQAGARIWGGFWQEKEKGTQNIVVFQIYFHCNLNKMYIPSGTSCLLSSYMKELYRVERTHERAALMENRFKVRYNPILSYLEENRQQCPLLQWISWIYSLLTGQGAPGRSELKIDSI